MRPVPSRFIMTSYYHLLPDFLPPLLFARVPPHNSLPHRPDKNPPKRSHALRYVLKDRSSDTELLVIQFTLYLKEDVDEHGNIKEGVAAGLPFGKMGEEERQRHMEARKDLPNQEVGNNEKEGGEEDEDKDVEREEQRKKEARRDSGNGTAVSRAFGDDEGVD